MYAADRCMLTVTFKSAMYAGASWYSTPSCSYLHNHLGAIDVIVSWWVW